MYWPLWVIIHRRAISDGQNKLHIWNLRASFGHRGYCYHIVSMQLLYAHTQHLRTKLVRSKKIARAHTKFYTNTSYFSMLNQIATFKVAISFIGVAWH